MGIKLAFMGSATFALPSLNLLCERGYDISAVITQPDKPSGRGQTMHGPPVKRRGVELNLPVHQPKSLKNDDTHELFRALAPDMILVVAYGKLLPPWLLELPRYGCINLHGSILPKYRGAAPVHWAIANGEEKTGVCSMRLEEGLDTGPVYLCEETHIGPEETAPQLYDRLAEIGAPLMLATVEGIVNGTLHPKMQDDSQATFAPILKKEHGFIDWTLPAAEIHNAVRAFNPWPGTVTRFRGSLCKILKTGKWCQSPITPFFEVQKNGVIGDWHHFPVPGTIVTSKRSMGVVCGDGGLLEILLIQPENRKPVSGGDFANGARIQPDEKFQAVMDN